jgi:FkbM family methyltransferase
MFLDFYERDLRRRVYSLLPPDGCLVDVGANVGFWSLPAARAMGESGAVLAFEPNPWAVRRLRHNLALNESRTRAKVEILPRAVGAAAGEAELTAPDLEVDSAQASLHQGPPGPGAVQRVSVPVTTLDDAVRRHVHVLKIDVEGHELSVLAGGAALFTTAPPEHVVVEMHGGNLARAGHSPEELAARLEALGYRAVDSDGPLPSGGLPRPLPGDFFQTVVWRHRSLTSGR